MPLMVFTKVLTECLIYNNTKAFVGVIMCLSHPCGNLQYKFEFSLEGLPSIYAYALQLNMLLTPALFKMLAQNYCLNFDKHFTPTSRNSTVLIVVSIK